MMTFEVMSLMGLIPRLTDVSTVLFGMCRPVGGVNTRAAGRADAVRARGEGLGRGCLFTEDHQQHPEVRSGPVATSAHWP
ncbi:hypothetical protein C7C46_00075 [Streptomyces tateyamensis]|uniref:Uncharacterized protein n=1 Tax=Streptomyces tateyamensis TaxID=565073 RepID=A0A2V4NNY4_9ACTN|nr:hypothetical protein C7C46_00075 [Streptomyces tateyamensis]